jgi:ElaB/YqjD/DUF883 family membrane-anchored ribosome-binding protein
MPHDIRSELSALQDDLAVKENPTSGQSTFSEQMAAAPKEKWADFERTLRELQTQLADAVGETETVLAEHPFAAVAAAFLLGVAAGRMMGAAK